jgi:hypothetical protein
MKTIKIFSFYAKIIKENEEKTALTSRLKYHTKRIRTYAYLEWSSWFLSKEGKK